MVDTWQPGLKTSNIDKSALKQLAQETCQAASVEALLGELHADRKQLVTGWLQLPAEQWLSALTELDSDLHRSLCELFTVGEMKIAEWQCGAKNPTIIILRLMKEQQNYPEKDFIRSLKKRTDNRYIPYGDALG